jgi:hypothetical protein
MKLAESASWKISTDEPEPMLIALYVREAAGLQPQIDPDIPRLEPAVPFGAEQLPGEAVSSAQWAAWWHQLLQGGGFWPEDKDPSDLHNLRNDPELQRLFYWPTPDLAAGVPSDTPELHALVRQHREAAEIWSEARKHEFVALSLMRQRVSLEWAVVQSVEAGLGRKARPFTFDMRVLPLAAKEAWRLSPGRALVSGALYRDRAAYLEWLQPIIVELA